MNEKIVEISVPGKDSIKLRELLIRKRRKETFPVYVDVRDYDDVKNGGFSWHLESNGEDGIRRRYEGCTQSLDRFLANTKKENQSMLGV